MVGGSSSGADCPCALVRQPMPEEYEPVLKVCYCQWPPLPPAGTALFQCDTDHRLASPISLTLAPDQGPFCAQIVTPQTVSPRLKGGRLLCLDYIIRLDEIL